MPYYEFQCPVCRKVEDTWMSLGLLEAAGGELTPPTCHNRCHRPIKMVRKYGFALSTVSGAGGSPARGSTKHGRT